MRDKLEYNGRMARKSTGKKVWLITWEWAGDHAAVPEPDRVAAVLRPQTTPATIKRLTELLYAAREYSAVDKLGALTFNPYPAALWHRTDRAKPFER